MSKFRIWNEKGEPITVEGDTAQVNRVENIGLTVKIKTKGKKALTILGAVAITEVSEKIKVE